MNACNQVLMAKVEIKCGSKQTRKQILAILVSQDGKKNARNGEWFSV